LKKCQ
jgi:Bromodomain/Bromodomain extra-terminal - transcription regulation